MEHPPPDSIGNTTSFMVDFPARAMLVFGGGLYDFLWLEWFICRLLAILSSGGDPADFSKVRLADLC